MRRTDLVGRSTERLPVRIARAQAALDASVDPRWRQDVRIAVRQGMLALPPCAVSQCEREMLIEGLCAGHHRRWIQRRSAVDMETFLAKAKFKVLDWDGSLHACLVKNCLKGQSVAGFCPHHKRQWFWAGRPPKSEWAAGVVVAAKPQGPLCKLVRCNLLGSQPAGYCRGHNVRWERLGRPTATAFEAHMMNYADSRWDFKRLPEQLKLELQYAMQRAEELQTAQRNGRQYSYIVRILLHIGATTLLEHTRAEWDEIFCRHVDDPYRSNHTQWRAWLGFAVEQLTDLVEGSGWESEYPRDVWEMRRLGLHGKQRRLDFTEVIQPWLRDLVKRWIHWRVTVEDKSPTTATCDLKAIRRMSGFLAATGQAAHSVTQFNRPVIESYLVWLNTQTLAPPTIRDEVSAIAVFLRALREHEDWAPTLPRTAAIYGGDYPRMRQLQARGLSTHVMVQVHEHLHRWRDPSGLFLTELMLGTGLRISDASALGFDPLVFDNDGHPYIHYWNHKMRRDAFVPIDRSLLAKLREQQKRTAERFPEQYGIFLATPEPRTLPYTGLRLIPRSLADRIGHQPFKAATYRQQLQNWIRECGITDEAGRPADITAHRWRHTYATDLINKGVRIEVIKQLLDHASLEMASHYARLLDTTVRTEWEAARAGRDDLPDSARPALADASWNNRARAVLPNGLCGLPRQQDCAHSNKCLSCPVFITTSADLPAHEEQRRRTLKLIAEFDDRGQTKLADQNRIVLDQLEFRIAEIRQNLELAKTAAEDLDDAG